MHKVEQDVLGEVLVQVFEEASFIFLEPVPQASPWAESPLLVTLEFEGPAGEKGKLLLADSQSLASELAANMLGTDPGDPESLEKGGSALKEMLNMIGGVLMGHVFGADTICKLGIPDKKVVPADESEALFKEAQSCVYTVDEDGNRIDFAAV